MYDSIDITHHNLQACYILEKLQKKKKEKKKIARLERRPLAAAERVDLCSSLGSRKFILLILIRLSPYRNMYCYLYFSYWL